MFKDWVYPAYARAMRPKQKRKRRRTDRGQLILTGALFALVLGLNTDRTLVYQLFALFFCLLIVARLCLALNKPEVAVSRRLPRYATAGQRFTYQITVVNKGEKVESDLTLVDNPASIPPTPSQFKFEREPDEESRNAYDRFIGFHRFMYLQRLNTGITTKPSLVGDIGIKSNNHVEIEALPLRRGLVSFESIDVMHQDPFSLNYGVQRIPMPDQLLVLPKRYQLNKQQYLQGGRNFQPGGINAAWSIGESDEFVSLRDYREGDPIRKIHWPSSAKRQKPVVREYQDEYYIRHALLLDLSHEKSSPIEEAISIAASHILMMSDDDSMLDLIYLTGRAEVITSGRGTNSIDEQLEALATLKRSDTPIEKLTEAFINHRRLISGCILILSQYAKGQQRLVKQVKTSGINAEIYLIVDERVESIPGDIRQLRAGYIQEDLASL